MDARKSLGALLLVAAVSTGVLAAEREPAVPVTTEPIVYVLDYSDTFFTEPEYLNRFKAAPPDLLHMGKATPISHLWGPVRMYRGENQWTGGPGHTLNWENIKLLTPDQVAERIEHIRETLKAYHGIGIPEIAPYISYHTIAGDHEKRLGFWEFYDHWDKYTKWAGPRPAQDPFTWLAVDKKGKFLPGSCGGYSPDYYAPLHRYRCCINNPDWSGWQCQLIKLNAQVGYDGCFIDNTHPDPCYCDHCKTKFREFLAENRNLDWVHRLTEGLDVARLALDSDKTPEELIRRWRLLYTGEHMRVLHEAAGDTDPEYKIFPNSGRIDDCLVVGSQCARLMFESTFAPGLMSTDEPPETADVVIQVADGPAEPKRIPYGYQLTNPATKMEMKATITVPTKAQVGKPVELVVDVLAVGASKADGDAAEDFYLLLRNEENGNEARLELDSGGPIGGTGSSRKPKRQSGLLKTTWTPKSPGTYSVCFGFRYTDDSYQHVRLRPYEARLS